MQITFLLTFERTFNENNFWREITDEHSDSTRNACATLFSNTYIFGRGESDGMIRQIELFILRAMLHDSRIDSSYYLVRQLFKVARASKGVIIIGGLITHIALVVSVDPHEHNSPTYCPKLGIDACLAMK